MLTERWRSSRIVTRGQIHKGDSLPGFVAELVGERVGLITYRMEKDECELVSLDSLKEGAGVGSALLHAVQDVAGQTGCARAWLITTNDNLRAIGFYQKRGWRLVAVHRDAIAQSRQLKPEIPLVGDDGIPVRDEIELEFLM